MLFPENAARLLAATGLLASLFAFRTASGGRETRELAAFTAVQLGTRVSVIVRQGSPQSVVVEAAPDDLLNVQTEVADSQLLISTKQTSTQVGPVKFNIRTATLSGPVTVYVTMPTVRGLAVSSSGSLRADAVQAQRLALRVSSSGQLLLGQVQAGSVRASLSSSGKLAISQLRADTLRAALSSSGSIVAAGVCAYSSLGISSSGSINTKALAVQDCQARLSGSGSCQVNAARTVDVHLSGSGSVVVSGHPQVTSHVSGSGRVRLAQ
ncbi:DUF2807 domain-containing protein [Hymenobacter sp. H14-R3]|uniref:GIN domain-containing protein n=1 Tax=Hymenobacter sp. H14-R3 TaxID=3046308 RepID=UPI0024B9275B|nr:DUF2807 domain-containing protein [Hymenobacter sp. H14-R3]MDJ0366542.1 DUF2807 domain-containing protein [Hymenobacter sp. H14-R3]